MAEKEALTSSMIFAAVNPKSARQYYRRRAFESFILLGGGFLFCAAVFSWAVSLLLAGFIPLLVGNVLAGLIAYYCYLMRNKQPMRIRCPNCRRIVLCKTPWICGECGHENLDVRKTTLLDECEQCHLPPKAYVCHHCEDPMFLSVDEDKTNPAHRVTTQGQEPRQRTGKRREVEESFEDKRRDIEKAKLVLTEEQIKAQIEAVKKGVGVTEAQMMTALDLQSESLTKFMDAKTAIHEAARRQKALNAEQCKNDRTELRKRNLWVDEWERLQVDKLT